LGFRKDESSGQSEIGSPTKVDPARANERPSGNGKCPTGVRAWGRRTAPRGLWFGLNKPGVASRPGLAAELRQRVGNVERLIRKLRSRKAETRRFDKGAPGALRIALPATEKVPEQSGKADASQRRESDLKLLVWGPGAGVEATGRL